MSLIKESKTKGSILVVDDEASDCELLSYFLQAHGYRVMTADSGGKAVEIIHKASFNLILLDLVMSPMDGFETLKVVRKSHSFQELPIIMTTVRDRSADVDYALELGANDYVTKPILFPLLLSRIQTWISTRPHIFKP